MQFDLCFFLRQDRGFVCSSKKTKSNEELTAYSFSAFVNNIVSERCCIFFPYQIYLIIYDSDNKFRLDSAC